MAKVYCFGNTENGELGLGGIEEEHILTPRKQRLPYDRRKYALLQVASGRNHTLLLLKSISHDRNTVFSCGSNERLQLGRVGSWKRLEEVNALSQHNICKIACGFNNSLVLSEAGQLFSWGCNLFGQLGIGKNEQEVGKPSLLKKLAARNIAQIACGGNHCLALTKNGDVYAWGSNAFGQLGLGTSGNCVNTPLVITSLQWTPVRQIAAGGSHSSVLTFTGAIYLWGKNEFGQLGLNDQINRKLPTLQHSLRNQKIAYISLGEEHSAALTYEGGLFTWGAGMYGQLGHGRNSNEILPRKVFELMGIAITQVSCGRCHTLVATKRGRTYSFGLNGSGQLGIGSTQAKYVPCDIRGSWIEIDVKEVVLRDGERSLFPCYQLNSSRPLEMITNSTETPKKLNENSLMKSNANANVSMEIDEVTDENLVTEENTEHCFVEEPDDEQTVARFVCVDDTVYPNANRSVEIDEYESDPDSDLEEQSQRTQYVVKEIIASKGDQSFVIVQSFFEKVMPRDFRQSVLAEEILKLDNILFEQFKDLSKDSIPLDIVDYIEEVFSSIPSWNASYIKQERSNDLSEGNNGKMQKFAQMLEIKPDDYCDTGDGQIQWSDAFHGFNMIEDADNERINELINQSISKILSNLPDLVFKDLKNSGSTTEKLDTEVLRIFQMLPLFHLFRMNSYSQVSQQLVTAFSLGVLSFTESAKKCLKLWWAQMPRRYFKNLIVIIKKSIELNLLEQHKRNESSQNQASEGSTSQIKQDVHQNLAYCLEVLKMLYATNKVVEKVSYKDFYIDGISEMFDLKVDYYLWKNHRQGSGSTKEYFLCDYSFIFDVPAKNSILATDSEIQQQSAAQSSVYRQLLLTPFHPGGTVVLNPYLIISVHRNTILQETINQLCLFSKHSEADFKKPLRVYFEGEEAIDAGQGMKKEFFLLLMKEILDEKYGMFMEYKETSTIWFHHSNDEDEVMYQLIGILCGIAIYNKVIINLPFPLVLYKKILNETLELDDLSHLDPLLTKNLKEILTPSFEKDEFDAIFGDLNFVITLQTFGSPVDYELCPGGKDRKLTYENREEYVQLYWKYILETSVRKQFASFLSGFMKVLDTDILKIFHAEEVMQLVSGQEVIDWEELQQITEYKPPFTKDHPTIRLFWKVFFSFSNEEKKKFLLFLTGSDRIPILGVKALNLVIQPMKVSDDHLPVAHTCFNILDLPQDYESEDREERLRSKLLKACEYTHGFALV